MPRSLPYPSPGYDRVLHTLAKPLGAHPPRGRLPGRLVHRDGDRLRPGRRARRPHRAADRERPGRLNEPPRARRAARGVRRRAAARADLVRRPDRAHRLLPRRVRRAPALADERDLRRPGGALPVPARPGQQPGRLRDRHAPRRAAGGARGVARLHAAVGASRWSLFAWRRRVGDIADAGWLHGLKLVAVAVVAQAVWGMARRSAPDRDAGDHRDRRGRDRRAGLADAASARSLVDRRRRAWSAGVCLRGAGGAGATAGAASASAARGRRRARRCSSRCWSGCRSRAARPAATAVAVADAFYRVRRAGLRRRPRRAAAAAGARWCRPAG